MRYKTAVRFLIWFVLAAGIFIAAVALCLPQIVQYGLEKRVPQYIQPNEIDFRIDKIGISRILISDILINGELMINQADIRYDLRKIPKIHITKLVVSGVRVNAAIEKNRKVKVQGLRLPKTTSSEKKPLDPGFFSYLPDRIRVRDSRIVLDAKPISKKFSLPFDILATLDKSDGQVDLQTGVLLFGEKINLLSTIDLQKGITHLLFAAKRFDLGHLNTIIRQINAVPSQLSLTGPADIQIESHSPLSDWSAKISRVGIGSPMDLQIKDIDTTLKLLDRKIFIDTTLSVTHPKFPSLSFKGNTTIDPEAEEPYQLHFKTEPSPKWELGFNDLAIVMNHPEVKLDFSADQNTGSGSLHFGAADSEGRKGDLSFNTSDIKFTSGLQLKKSAETAILTANPNMVINKIFAGIKDMHAKFSSLNVSGSTSYHLKKGPEIRMQVSASGGSAVFKQKSIKIFGMQLNLPFAYPVNKPVPAGSFRIGKVIADKKYSVGVTGTIRQKGLKTVKADGRILADFMSGIKPSFTGVINLENSLEANFDFGFPSVELTGADLKTLAPQIPGDAKISMKIGAKGQAHMKNSRMTTKMTLAVSDGRINMPELKLNAEGINTQIQFNDLLKPESIPGQILTVDTVDIDKIKVSDARVRFTVEDARYLLLENLKFKWCNGLVSSESIRFPQSNNLYTLILYCDRLDLAELLMQMGVFNAQGNGSLNGRIPIVYHDGNIAFDNGFLFSTPGSGGKVSVNNTNKLIAGIPMDSPQFAQLDVAREALKDFDYKWAKLTLNTLEDTLFVNMEMDGKPAKVLPFVYKRELGGFARVDASHPGSHFQGIKLDVNLNLPFNDVLKFGNKLKSLFNQ